jgi:pilus assembly protein TadC
VETVSAPGVTLGDVEGLLAGLSGPLAEGESPRERADQLLRLLSDEALGELYGKDGQPVRPAALEALLALGYPYALEVPPEVLERMHRLPPRALSRSSRWGVGLAAVSAVVPGLVFALVSTRTWTRYLDELAILTGSLFLPAVLSALAERYRLRWLKSLANGALGLMGGLALFFFWVLWSQRSRESYPCLVMGVAMLASAVCLRHRDEFED